MLIIVNNKRKDVIDYMNFNLPTIISKTKNGVDHFLERALREGKVDNQLYQEAKTNTISNIENWLSDKNIDQISPDLKNGIIDAIEQGKWEDIVNAFRKNLSFGTGGIRGLMAFDKASIVKLKEAGIDAQILKGPNTINNLVLLKTSAGVAKYGNDKGFSKIVIGYDSRIRGFDFAKCIAELFLAYGFTVYMFDEPCPYPEVTFAIPYREIRADMGIIISASHNDYRYNGYKLSCSNGSQFDPEQRAGMYNNYISKATTDDIKQLSINEAAPEKVVFLGGDIKLNSFDYSGHELIDIHGAHREHVKSFLLLEQDTTKKLNIGYCAFHGAGRIAVPRLLHDVGFTNVKIITKNGLNDLNGLFPSFNSEPGKEQQPDPGAPRAAKVAVDAFKEQYPGEFEKTDIIIGTDPDADRCGVVVKVPENQRFLYGNKEYHLLPADDVWALVMWFRLKFDKSLKPDETFVVLSHPTTDSIVKLALKYGVGVIKSWVGFAALSAGVRDTWDNKLVTDLHEGKKDPQDLLCNPFIQETFAMDNGKRKYNLGAMEQTNGFSILGYPPKDESSLGIKGHVRDKDGTFASVLVAEIAEWAKQNNTTIFEMIDDHIYLDPDIGLFVNYYEPDPLDGEYPGIEGDRIKKSILRRCLGLYQFALARGLEIGGLKVKSAVIYRTGKYDDIYLPTTDFQFPDEGVRFYFDTERLNSLMIRPSGTTNSLRFHVQLHDFVTKENIIDKKKELHQTIKRVMEDIRDYLQAPRNSELEQ
jgi:phosphoglucomutase